MFKDKYMDIEKIDVLFTSVINTNTYVSVDPAYISSFNLFVRRQHIESGPLQD